MIKYVIEGAAISLITSKFGKGDVVEFTVNAPSDEKLLEAIDDAADSMKGMSFRGVDDGLLVFQYKGFMGAYASTYWLAIQNSENGNYDCAMVGQVHRYQYGSKSKLKKNCEEFKDALAEALE